MAEYQEIRSHAMSLKAYDFIEQDRLKVEVRTGELGQVTVVVSGDCPRCEHFHQDSFSPNIVAGAKLRGANKTLTDEAAKRLNHVVICDCAEPHEGRPDGVDGGCGLRYLVEFETDAS